MNLPSVLLQLQAQRQPPATKNVDTLGMQQQQQHSLQQQQQGKREYLIHAEHLIRLQPIF